MICAYACDLTNCVRILYRFMSRNNTFYFSTSISQMNSSIVSTFYGRKIYNILFNNTNARNVIFVFNKIKKILYLFFTNKKCNEYSRDSPELVPG